jgi:hypothetical protein
LKETFSNEKLETQKWQAIAICGLGIHGIDYPRIENGQFLCCYPWFLVLKSLL